MRRGLSLLATSAAVIGLIGLLAGVSLAAKEAKPIKWENLIPTNADGMQMSSPRGVVQHGQFPMTGGPVALGDRTAWRKEQPAETGRALQAGSSGVVTEFNGERVTLEGFIVPLRFEGTKIKEFILVPYVGACIHVPPPPANQVVFVETEEPIEFSGLFEPVSVTGTLSTLTMSTELAEVGYHIAADKVDKYDE